MARVMLNQSWHNVDSSNILFCVSDGTVKLCVSISCCSIIQSKHNPQMVLSVSMPTAPAKGAGGGKDMVDQQEPSATYVGCTVTLQKRKGAQFGRANQRWYLDEATGMLQAFHTDSMDKEITAANRANVCTYAVVGGTEIDQPVST